MPCSKIFSGDLPELTYEIIKYFRNDFSTLHSCILVNRLWCRLAIPLLWEDPFSNLIKKNFLYYLNDDIFKLKLNENEIKNYLFPSNRLFNYPGFIKYINIWSFIFSVERWISTAPNRIKAENNCFAKNYLNDCSLIIRLLFEIFIENEIDLHTLDIEIPVLYHHTYDQVKDILGLVLQNPTCKIKILNLYICDSYSPLDNIETSLVEYFILQVVNSQQNLKKISLGYNYFPLYQSLLLSKNPNCSNTLNTIILYHTNLNGVTNLDKVFEHLNVLESVHFIYCYPLNNSLIQQIVNLTKPFKLKSLFINVISQIESLQLSLQIEPLRLLLQKSGNYLENFGFSYNDDLLLKQQLLGLIKKYCKNIKYFDFLGFENQIIYLSFNLIENIKQNLNYLLIKVCEYYQVLFNNIEHSSTILQNLGQILPSKLEYLCLNLYIKANDLEVFLKNSQNTFIKKFLIYNNIQADDDDIGILPYIKEYIMKEKRVEYLAIKDTFFKRDPRHSVENMDSSCLKDNLSDLKDEVEEFKLHNVKVQSYYDLDIHVYDFIKKID
jgi:hypothetical protein